MHPLCTGGQMYTVVVNCFLRILAKKGNGNQTFHVLYSASSSVICDLIDSLVIAWMSLFSFSVVTSLMYKTGWRLCIWFHGVQTAWLSCNLCFVVLYFACMRLQLKAEYIYAWHTLVTLINQLFVKLTATLSVCTHLFPVKLAEKSNKERHELHHFLSQA